MYKNNIFRGFMKVGAFTGKFYPPHIGHISAVDFALTICDKVIIVISKNNKRNEDIRNKSNFDILDAELIKSWFEEYYQGNDRVKVAILDEEGMEPYPKCLKDWTDKFKRQFPEVNVKIADESYREFNEKYFPDYEFLSIERDCIPVHSTNIRENISKYFDYLIPPAKEYFRKKYGL